MCSENCIWENSLVIKLVALLKFLNIYFETNQRREEPEDATETNVEAVPLPATTHSAGDLFDLGDRLTQKLNEQKKEFALKLSNYSCILQDLNIVDNENEIQLEQMLDGLKDLGISDPWLLNALTESKKICYEVQTHKLCFN